MTRVTGRRGAPVAKEADARRTIERIVATLADVEPSIACAGTSVESTTYGVRGKNFLFVRTLAKGLELRLILEASHADAAQRAEADPVRYSVGAGGWSKITLANDNAPPVDLLETWIAESYALITAKKRAPR